MIKETLGLLACMAALASCQRTAEDALSSGPLEEDLTLGNDLDILFVIDDSASTGDKQTLFAQNFPQLIAALDMFPGGRPNLHIGVVSTTVDLGVDGFGGCPTPNPDANGLLRNTPTLNHCNAPRDRYISDLQPAGGGPREVNYAGGDLAATFSCIAQLGSGGCGFEAQLEAMKRALDGTRPENAGFLRPDAGLLVVILTDEDDCSVQDPSLFTLPDSQVGGVNDFRCQPLFAYQCDQPISAIMGGTYTNCGVREGSYLHDPLAYVTYLTSLKADPSRVATVLIAGDPQTTIATGTLFNQALALLPSCMATIGGNPVVGRPAIRLDQFRAAFDDRGVFTSVCQPSYGQSTREVDYSTAIADIGTLAFKAVTPCIRGSHVDLTDTDLVDPGLQLNCTLADVTTTAGSAPQVGDAIPSCAMIDAGIPDPSGARPCWWVESNPSACATESGLELHVEGSVTPAGATTVRLACPTSTM